jgi:hypothetical protein
VACPTKRKEITMANASIVTKKRKSSGFDLLLSEIDTLSPSAQHELTNLIGHHVVAAARTTGTDTATASPKMRQESSRNDASQQNDHHSKNSSSSSSDGAGRKKVVTSSMNDDEILHLVAQSRASLLGSICFLFDDHDNVAGPKAVGAVSAMQVVKQCGLVVDPLHSPGRMDARDVVLAALFFLCGTSYLKIKSTGTKPNTSGDLLKLSYEKAYDWKWEEVKGKVMGDLEDAFYKDDPSHYDLLSRTRFLPGFDSDSVPSDARFNLVLKGVVPPTSTPKTTTIHEIVEK